MRYHVHQKKAENRTGWLMLLFALLLFGMGVLVHLFVVFVTSALGAENAGYLHPSAPSMVMIALLWGVSMAGMAFRRMDVKGGGAVLARRFGAVQASTRDRHFDQKRLCNVVAEMTIAAGLPPTQVFVLPHDSHINAFVLGTAPDNCAIVVTQGALDAFDRAELQAVIAHELAHIRNGDLPLNMRLLVVLAGLLAIDEVGAMLIRGGTFFDERQGADRTAAPAMIVGLLFRIPGFVGSMCASVLRAGSVPIRSVMPSRPPTAGSCSISVFTTAAACPGFACRGCAIFSPRIRVSQGASPPSSRTSRSSSASGADNAKRIAMATGSSRARACRVSVHPLK